MTTEYFALREKCFEHTKKELQKAVTEDVLVIQTKEMIDDLNRICNQLTKRMREWSGGWIPELAVLDDHESYIKKLTKNKEEILTELGCDESVGTNIPQEHIEKLQKTALAIATLYDTRAELIAFSEEELKKIMPNTLEICGVSIASNLLAHAGSLKKLSRYPAGTIQLLGAESALFRHLRNKKHKSPKHGTIINHPLVQKTQRRNRGKVARALADKISIAAKVDYFKGEPCGERLRQELEARFS